MEIRASKNRFIKKIFFSVVSLLLGACFILSAPLTAKAQDTITVKAVTSFPRNVIVNTALPDFIKMVENRTDGRLKINYVGGPEVIKTFDQGEALRTGTIDMILYTPMSYLKSFNPVFQAKGLSRLAAWEERRAGVHDLWDEISQKEFNAKYLGTIHSIISFRIYSNKRIEKIEDLKGLRIRTMPLYSPFLKKLGANPVIMPPTEVYTAMQRGVVDGFMFSSDFEFPDWGWHEVTEYKISPGVFQLDNGMFMNLDKYKSLPEDVQETLEHCVEVFEGVDTVRVLESRDRAWEIMQEEGMEEIVLPPEDAEKLIETAYSVTWKEVVEDAPEYGPKLKELTSEPME